MVVGAKAMTARHFPAPWTIRDLLHGLLIALTFPGHLIWELATATAKGTARQDRHVRCPLADVRLYRIGLVRSLGSNRWPALASGPLNSSYDPKPTGRFPPPWSVEEQPVPFCGFSATLTRDFSVYLLPERIDGVSQ